MKHFQSDLFRSEKSIEGMNENELAHENIPKQNILWKQHTPDSVTKELDDKNKNYLSEVCTEFSSKLSPNIVSKQYGIDVDDSLTGLLHELGNISDYDENESDVKLPRREDLKIQLNSTTFKSDSNNNSPSNSCFDLTSISPYDAVLQQYGIDSDDSITDPIYKPVDDDDTDEFCDDIHPKKKMKKNKVYGLTGNVTEQSTNKEQKDSRHIRLVDYSSSDSSEEDNEIEVLDVHKPKKVIPQPQCWKVNVRKRKRNLGLEYVSRKGITVPTRTMRKICGDKCKLQCGNSKFSNSERQTIFDTFWALGDIEKQRCYVSSCMRTISPKYRYAKPESNRAKNNAFYLTCASKPDPVRVCKLFFCSTLGISFKMIRTTLLKTGEIGEIQPDLRAKTKATMRIKEEERQVVIAHIQSIPRIESHYLRSQTTREYIDGSKSIMDLYRDYKTSYEENNKQFVKYSMYRHIFNTSFNISFFQPKKDQCELCVAFQNKSAEEREKHDVNYHTHLSEKKLSREEKNNDKSRASEKLVVAVYDLEAVLPLPRGDVSVFYYISKVSVYNFTIHELSTKKTCCYLWHEGEGGWGPNELASCLLRFLLKKSEEKSTDFDVIFYSDNCPGQNKNKFFIGLYNHALKVIPNLRSITHKFLIKGHTQNEGDSVHSLIEKKIKQSLKSGPIYVPEQYAQIIRLAKNTLPFYEVIEMSHVDFFDFKDVTEQLGNNFTINTDGETNPFTNIKILNLSKNYSESFLYKTSYSDEYFKKIEFRRKRSRVSGESTNTIKYILKPAYKKALKISEKKKTELLKLFNRDKQIIPQVYYLFYSNL